MILEEVIRAHLREEVEVLTTKHSVPVRDPMEEDSGDDGKSGSHFVVLSKVAFLETAFLANMANLDRKKQMDRYVVPDCDQICYPKLDLVPKTALHKGGWPCLEAPAVLAGRNHPANDREESSNRPGLLLWAGCE